MPRNIFTILVIAVVVVAALWLVESPPPVLQSQSETPNQQLILTQYFDEMHTTQYNQDGLREHEFIAARIEQHKLVNEIETDNGTTTFNQPNFTFYQNNAPYWQVIAQTGVSKQNSESVWLSGKVELMQNDDANLYKIQTQSLLVDPTAKYAETNDVVAITGPGVVSTGEGMVADIENQTVKLLSNTKTRYEMAK